MIKTVFFDFNGTIINDVDLCLNILNKMLEDDGKSPITKERYLDIFCFPIKSYYELAGFDFTKKSFEELSVDFINMYQKASLNCSLYPGVKQVLSDLKMNGYRLVLLSASQIDNLKEQVSHFKLDHLFDNVLGINDIFARSKVDVGLNFILENNINPTTCLMFGDTLHDKEVAQKLGMKIALFSKGHQSKRVLSKANEVILDSYEELERLILDDEKNN